MTTRRNHTPSDALPGEADLTRIYEATGNESPPPELDARILAAARAAAPARPTPSRWAIPLSTAAVLMLSVTVVLFMTRQGVLDQESAPATVSEYDSPNAQSSAVVAQSSDAMRTDRREKEAAPTLTKSMAKPDAIPEPAKSLAPAPAAAPAPVLEHQLGESLPMEAKKKAEARATASALMDRAEEQSARRRDVPARAAVRGLSNEGGLSAMKFSADVTAVDVSGNSGAYTFSVSIRSPDTGCQQFADWWEVVSEEGALLYRRVLLHSHVDEQPFTRSGGPVPIQPETVVWIRAHMNTTGYGNLVFKGSVKNGFVRTHLPQGFAKDLAKQPPLPEGCDF